MDFLGLRTLSIIKDTLSNIRKSKGIDIDIDDLFRSTIRKRTNFSAAAIQLAFLRLESTGMQKYLKDLKPTQFEDLIAMNALYRPTRIHSPVCEPKHVAWKIGISVPLMPAENAFKERME